jgi:transposase-like protein
LVDTPSVREKSTMGVQKPKRQFTAEFKAEAVKMVQESKGKRSPHSIAVELGITPSTLRQWVRKAAEASGDVPKTRLATEERAELATLRRKVRELEMEKEILKKAAAFFAKENL